MTKRDFIEKSISGIAGLFFLTSFQKKKPSKKEHVHSSPCALNQVFGHSLPHSEFLNSDQPTDLKYLR